MKSILSLRNRARVGSKFLARGDEHGRIIPCRIWILKEGREVAAYDANVRSPLIFNMPGRIPQNRVCKTPVSGPDLVSTMLRFTGMREPWQMHGRDLTPLLKDPDGRWDHPAMLVATGRRFGSDTNSIPEGSDVFHGEVPWYVMIRDRRHKYVRPLVHDLEELYDLDKDPEELENLAVKAEHKSRLRKMRAQAISELRRTKCGFVEKMPAIREA